MVKHSQPRAASPGSAAQDRPATAREPFQTAREPSPTAQEFFPIAEFLATSTDGVRPAPQQLWGFGGVHGGLALAAMTADMTAVMRAAATTDSPADQPAGLPASQPTGQPAQILAARTSEQGFRLQSVTGRLHRAVRDSFTVDVTQDAATRSTRALSASLQAGGGDARDANGDDRSAPLASATALFGLDGDSPAPRFAPAAPRVPGWQDGELFRPPPAFVPISGHTEIRALGGNRPFAGGAEPKLTAWVRMTEDDLAPDELRLLFLVDALAPSYAAVLPAPLPVPTVELTAHFSGKRAASPWVLIEATTTGATPGGWVTETINVWGEDAAHLVEARQLRLVRPARTS
ncbi:acyl-CoA thioesterase domain-containing protein [Leucobacter sp. BZR 635]